MRRPPMVDRDAWRGLMPEIVAKPRTLTRADDDDALAESLASAWATTPPQHDLHHVQQAEQISPRERGWLRWVGAGVVIIALASAATVSLIIASHTVPEPKRINATTLSQIQSELDRVAKADDCAVSLAFIAEDIEYTLVSGTLEPVSGRRISRNDTFLFGSGTKTFVAARTMQLVENGALDFNASVSSVLEPLLRHWVNKSWPELFRDDVPHAREWAANMTIGQLVSMRSGLSDVAMRSSEVVNRTLIQHPHTRWTPLQFIEWTTGSAQPFVCKPGSCSYYSSTGFQVAGLVLLAVQQRETAERHVTTPNGTWTALDIAGPLFQSDQHRFNKLHFFSDEPHLWQHMTVPATECVVQV